NACKMRVITRGNRHFSLRPRTWKKPEHITTNLGVRSSNLFGRAILHSRTKMGTADMKPLVYSAIFAILVATQAFGADAVSLVGTWTGQRDRIAKDEGRRGGLATLVITEQQGNTFSGRLKRSNPTGDVEEPLWGAFTPGAKLIMGSDDEGTYI